MKIRKLMGSAVLATLLVLSSGCGDETAEVKKELVDNSGAKKVAFLTTYADIALASYTDSLSDAVALRSALATFTTTPTAANLQAAKDAWIASRETYLQTEIFRLSGTPIDSEGLDDNSWVTSAYGAPEGEMNAWPLNEGLIDYQIDETGATTTGNIIDGTLSAGDINVTAPITEELLSSLNELDDDESNVATGYHAIEFLLWGQDQDYENGTLTDNVTSGAKTAGQRPLSDYTTGDEARRKAYLLAAADKLITDLTTVRDAWNKTVDGDKGAYRAAFLNKSTTAANNLSSDVALKQIFIGMGTYMITEMAADRISASLLGPNEEEEHSCFSDNTHRDVVQDFKGFENLATGSYAGKTAETTVSGAGLYTLLSASRKSALEAKIAEVNAAMKTMDDMAKAELAQGGMHYDYQIRGGDSAANIRDISFAFVGIGNLLPIYAEDLGL